MTPRRLLFLGHRWLGIALCLFMLLWFVSGIVMLYVGYPKLSNVERLQRLPALSGQACCVSPAKALGAVPADFNVSGLRLTSIAGRPSYIVSGGKSRYLTVDGKNGQILKGVSDAQAMAAAQAFAPSAIMLQTERLDEDAWTHSRAMDGHRPLIRVALDDDELKYLYVSGFTGEVIRDVTRNESRWNWVGAWLHWLYPFRGGWVDAWWTEIVIYTALSASVLTLAGLVVGWLRWRRRAYNTGSHSPYRQPMMRWHHWSGLIFGVLALTWISSGLFSMNPWKLFDAGAARPVEARWTATGLDTDLAGLIACFANSGITPAEIEWRPAPGGMLVLARNASGARVQGAGEPCNPDIALPVDVLQRTAAALMPQSNIVNSTFQVRYDWHYYARSPQSMGGHQDKPLPAYVVQYDDPAGTTLYLDPLSGRIVQRLDSHLRVKRWLFAFFHSWDWLPLLERRPLWDVLMILGSLGGLAISLTGMIIGWRRLHR